MNEAWSLPPLVAAQTDRLFALYKRGSAELLPFFPATSLHWLKAQREGRNSYWQKDWEPSQFNAGAESQDPYVALAWNGCDPFGLEFEMLAGQIYGPMLEHAAADEEAEA